jgi:hypothetical protein
VIRRRTWLKLGGIGTVLMAVAGTGLVLTTTPGFAQGKLSNTAAEACRAIARAVLDGRLPADTAARDAALGAYLRNLETVVAGFPAAVQSEVSELLTVLSTTPGRVALTGVIQPWAWAEVDEVHAALASMRTSSLALKLQAYHALRDLTHAAWYADEARWPELGYPGPRAV